MNVGRFNRRLAHLNIHLATPFLNLIIESIILIMYEGKWNNNNNYKIFVLFDVYRKVFSFTMQEYVNTEVH